MPVYEVKTWTASDYSPTSGWQFKTYPDTFSSINEQEARLYYANQASQVALLAMHAGTAIKVQLRKSDEKDVHTLETTQYEGEDILHWFVAYHVPGQHPVEERRYISRILVHSKYYAFMHPAPDKECIPVAVAETLDELQATLGDDFHMYEYSAE